LVRKNFGRAQKQVKSPFVLKSRQQKEYSNFINSIQSDYSKKTYAYCLEQFLTYNKVDLHKLLLIRVTELTDIIIQYLVEKKVSRQYKSLIVATLKHACDMNDVLLNWKRIKKFVRSTKTGNEIAGRDRAYEHKEIEKILSYSEQRLRTCYLILLSTGMRIGGLHPLKMRDLERIQDLYKVTVYSGEKEQYTTFMTPEAAKELDLYLDYRRRRGEHITSDSYVIVKRPSADSARGIPFKGYSLRSILQFHIDRTGVREIGSIDNRFKRKEVSLLHGMRKFFTKQLMDSKVDKAIVELLLGHDIGLTGKYYRPTEQDMLQEYLKAVPALTISNEERLKFKLEERVQIEKTKIAALEEQFNKFRAEVKAMQKRKRK
jgi:site-specific recombinase XerD